MSGSIDSQNGSTMVAMIGDHCVAIASDKRLGAQMQTVSINCKKIFQINDSIFIGLSGLMTDADTVHEKLRHEVNLLELREERPLDPKRFINLVKSLLYKHRFGPYFVQPIIAGLEPGTNNPILATSDSIGAMTEPNDFAVAGTSSDSLYGICESLWRPGMNPDELFKTISTCLISAIERDGLSGWGGIVYIVTPEQIITKEIKTRMD
ncbi:Proteasome subunit beta type-3 [Histomonas meleagridis]|uniref:Proteasome subunit beta type-3 n=1 Tax=Histomonas meleagridis TaxID=135588 RepID=UPI00355A4F9A|nr:Proteasome subunit beta type-3 [Histomonas meleagridis]KAH0799931.1 Proteasome subunit beta type-3 [Histomonas meleagridis]